MAYPPNSILQRIDPLPDVEEDVQEQVENEETGQISVVNKKITKPNPLNKLRVVATSPVNQASVEAWQGSTDNEYVIVTPHPEFGGNENAPVSVLNREYEVLEYGDEEDTDKRIELESPAHKRQLARSPEQIFAAEAVAQRKAAKADEKPKGGELRGAALAAKQRKEAAAEAAGSA